MRRLIVILGAVVTAVAASTPAYAYAHDRVADPWLHTALDVLTLVMVTSPLWTAYLWGPGRRGALLALIGVVQIPAAVFAFVPIADPVLHAVALLVGVTSTVTSIWYVRRAGRAAHTAGRPAVR
ncbi:hypothetical protein LX16_0760 [Stackebrandtia albiflava]|uniref:SPW repeat-containing protein n=1 Tax=Stackebrandtia albiflava TaxID=406432 RepID=A0A562VB11_9ACTN|nr:hypothetical protein [Stackebrandtia albiflava]TWJ15062.1 hypothetical protein LX16_0760 [Stackebrandtia albiflava]